MFSLRSAIAKPLLSRVWKFLKRQKVIFAVWVVVAVVITSKQFILGSYNNYAIFKYTYFHALERLNLYSAYPAEHLDSNHYGPLFSLLIAPFAVLPDLAGLLLWQLANVIFLYFAILQLPLDKQRTSILYWIILNELVTAMLSFQFNISITAIIILTYALIEKKKNFWAAFFIVLGTLIKLYGIVGLAFFFFVKNKSSFVLSLIFWAITLFTLPMIFFSPQFILQSYTDWYVSLAEKQGLNASLNSMQDISLMGMVRRISGNPSIPNLQFIIAGVSLFALPYLRIKQYESLQFRMLYLCSVLIFVVIFSNSSESPTYIIAMSGVGLWFLLEDMPKTSIVIALFVFAMVLTSFSPTDIFPRFIRNEYIKPYSLKALPCVLIWFFLWYKQITGQFNTIIKES